MAESWKEEVDRLSDEMMAVSKEQFDYIKKYRDIEKPEDYSDQLSRFADRSWDLAQRLNELAHE